jgi:hypothetical protein|tara:strand:+ start:158 stop:310 length:153 start_codon:yes stop_codon:yes gene_type:complete
MSNIYNEQKYQDTYDTLFKMYINKGFSDAEAEEKVNKLIEDNPDWATTND